MKVAAARWRLRVLGCLAFLIPTTATAQAIRQFAIVGAPARSAEGFGWIASVAELPDGSVVVADSRDNLLRTVDFGTATVATLGRHGDGPGEYRGVSSLVVLPGDTVLAHDHRSRRAILVAPSGVIARSQSLPGGLNRGNGMTSPFLASDRLGRLYFATEALDTKLMSPTAEGTILRWAPWGGAAEVMTAFAPRRGSEVVSALVPFVHRDAWAVRADGLVARVLATEYAVVWTREGREVGRTDKLPHQRLPISTADCQARKDSIRSGPTGGVGARPGNTAPVGVPDQIRVQWADCPEARPPIADTRDAARFDPSGVLWVLRERGRGDPVAQLDMIDQARGLVGRVALPAGRRLVGFGKRHAYLAMTDDDGLEWLERYPLPTP